MLSQIASKIRMWTRTGYVFVRPYFGLLALLILAVTAVNWMVLTYEENSSRKVSDWNNLFFLLVLSFVCVALAVVTRTPQKHETLSIIERNAGWLTFVSYSFTAMALIGSFVSKQFTLWLLIGIYLSASSTLLALTRPIDYKQLGPDKNGDNKSDPVEEDNYVINGIFRLAYGFVFLCVIALVALAFNNQPLILNPTRTELPREYHPQDVLNNRVNTLIAIVKGCDFQYQEAIDPTASTRLERLEGRMPEQAHCGDLPPQWVLSIGGNVLLCHVLNNCAEAIAALNNEKINYGDLATLKQELSDLQEQKHRLETEIADHKRVLSGLTMENNIFKSDQVEKRIRAFTPCISCDEHSLLGLSREIEALKQKIAKAQSQLKHQEQVFEQPLIFGQPITGGIVVPIYFLILAMIGALISMARKLPEFQRRVTPAYHLRYIHDVKENPKLAAPMTGAEARELVMFQMVQVLTSVGVAIIAYSWATPNEMAAGAVLAFIAGFSSEIVLIAVRGVSKRLVEAEPRVIAKSRLVSREPIPQTIDVTNSDSPKPSPALRVRTVSLAPLEVGQEVKLLNSKMLPNGNVLELLSVGTVKSIRNTTITVLFELDGKPLEINLNRSDLAPSEQVGASKDDLRG
ncbi:hypothetical protein [uncultured Alteromonas sp.]|jgi:hypothetical protein|uniref:hypothetical protein n=1 Tax=uncultured Alteromonas sp. TaxID=179113 RepID=UPI0025E4B771|nr:hypothetical protein [uncultured Alteromonas sp.]MCP4866379.1 hypothetical protein [Alteromonas sp.]